VAYAHDSALAGGNVGMRTTKGGGVSNFNVTALNLASSQPLPVSDALNASTPTHQLDVANWQETVGNFSVSANGAVGKSNGINLAAVNGLLATDSQLQAHVAFSAVGQSAGLVTRYSGPGDRNMYLGMVKSLSGGAVLAQIYKNVGGVWFLLAKKTVTHFAGALRFQVTGHTLALALDNTLVLSVNDNSITGPGSVGLRASAGAAISNFTAS
jgi:hypothetical protein